MERKLIMAKWLVNGRVTCSFPIYSSAFFLCFTQFACLSFFTHLYTKILHRLMGNSNHFINFFNKTAGISRIRVHTFTKKALIVCAQSKAPRKMPKNRKNLRLPWFDLYTDEKTANPPAAQKIRSSAATQKAEWENALLKARRRS